MMRIVFATAWLFLPLSLQAAPATQPGGVKVDKDVAYLGTDRREKADLYQPAERPTGKRPAILIIHGGGWTGGDKGAAREIGIGQTVAANDWIGLSINYQLATKETPSWPQCFDDCRTAVQFLKDNADKYSIDVEKIGVIGGSAGGHLSLMMGTQSAGASRVKAVVALYPPTDLTDRGPNLQLFGVGASKPEAYKSASPVHQLTPDFPPVLLLHGTADKTVPIAQSANLEAAMKKAGLQVALVIIPGAPHTFPLKTDKFDHRQTVIDFFTKAFAANATTRPLKQ